MELPIGKVVEIRGFNPRKELGDLGVLAASIREHGIIEPLVVRKNGHETFGLICGHRRFAAARKAKLKSVPVTVRNVEGIEALAIAVSENSTDARTALKPLEEAEVFSRFKREGKSAEAIGKLCGCSGQKVRKTLELLKAPKPVLRKLRSGALSKMAALAIAELDEKVQRKVLTRLEELPGEATEATVKLIAREIAPPVEPSRPAPKAKVKTKGRRGKVARPAKTANGKPVAEAVRYARKEDRSGFWTGVTAGLLFSSGRLAWLEVSPSSSKLRAEIARKGR
jgi:ParB family chromosome partitioning protein